MDTVRPLVAADLGWVVELSARDAAAREAFAPRFWRRAPDARQIHSRHLAALIADPAVAGLRTAHAFAFAGPGVGGPAVAPGRVMVDDTGAERADDWVTEGPALLRRLSAGSRVRVVCPVPHPERAAVAAALGLTRVQSWWHRDLSPRPGEAAPLRVRAARGRLVAPASLRVRAARGRLVPPASLRVRGARGHLVTAPPVYAPGGPVLLVTSFDDERARAEIERRAEARGAAVSVVTREPGAKGYRRICDFYEDR